MIFRNILLVFALISVFMACEKNEDSVTPETTELVTIASANSTNDLLRVELLAEVAPFVGYNNVWVRITENTTGEVLRSASVTLKPIMQMTAMQHSAPVEQPAGVANEAGLFEGAIVFIMAGNATEGWSVKADVAWGDLSESVTLVIPEVKALEETRVKSLVSPIDGKSVFIVRIEPQSPKVGINDLEFAVYYRENMMSFPPLNNATVSFVPQMPSMGHSSENNVDPAAVGAGHYVGKVSFSMLGWWTLNLTLKQSDDLISDAIVFDVTL